MYKIISWKARKDRGQAINDAGKIQSGKTKSFIGVISLAFDSEYDLSVVLTKNSNELAK